MPLRRRIEQGIAAGLSLAVLWSYWPVLYGVVERWTLDPKYSHGYFVPVFAAWLLWYRYRRATNPVSTDVGLVSWGGLAVLFVAGALHAAGVYFYVDFLAEIALLPCLAGLCLCLGGWQLCRTAAPSIGFLAFMLPLPFRVEVALPGPLQKVATLASTYLLQTCGLTASAEGNQIVLNHGIIEVVEACSGLGMLVTFCALTTGVAIVLKRPLLDKLVVLISAVPVALLVNVIRITATGILYETWDKRIAQGLYHEGAGMLMPPLGLLIIGLELWILSRLLVARKAPVPIAFNVTRPVAPSKSKASRGKNSRVGV
jgi:exosortase